MLYVHCTVHVQCTIHCKNDLTISNIHFPTASNLYNQKYMTFVACLFNELFLKFSGMSFDRVHCMLGWNDYEEQNGHQLYCSKLFFKS